MLGEHHVLPQVVTIVLGALPRRAGVPGAGVEEEVHAPLVADLRGQRAAQRHPGETGRLQRRQCRPHVPDVGEPLDLDDHRVEQLDVCRPVLLDGVQDVPPLADPRVDVERHEAEQLKQRVPETPEGTGRHHDRVPRPHAQLPQIARGAGDEGMSAVPPLREELGLGGRPGRRRQRGEFLAVDTEQPGERVTAALTEALDILFVDERNASAKVVQRADLARVDTSRVPALTVERRPLVRVLHQLDDPLLL